MKTQKELQDAVRKERALKILGLSKKKAIKTNTGVIVC